MDYEKIIKALADIDEKMTPLFPEYEEAGEGVVVDEYQGIRNGDTIALKDGRTGVVEHIMVGGTLGIDGSAYAIETSEDFPGMTIRLIEDGEQTEFLLNITLEDVAL